VTTSSRILGLAGQAVSGAASAARHPVAAASYAFGMAKGATSVTIDVVRYLAAGPEVPQQRAAGEPTSRPAPTVTGERTNVGGLTTEAAEPRMPGGGGEAFEHEPHAEARDVAHGEAADDPREVDFWAEEAAPSEIDIETPVGTTGADVGSNPDTTEADLQQPGTEPLLDPATAKAVRSEAETLRKAADLEKE
jgi:hypothetical protein